MEEAQECRLEQDSCIVLYSILQLLYPPSLSQDHNPESKSLLLLYRYLTLETVSSRHIL